MKNFYFLIITLLSINVTIAQTTYTPMYDGVFGGVTYDQAFTFPTGAEPWGGFANNNTSIYPLSFPNAGQISFKATVSADAEVYFRFEANPFPDVDPAIVTANVSLLAANDPGTVYTVDIPGNATNTYNSALFYVVTPDVEVSLSEIKINTYDTDGMTILSIDYPIYDGIFGGVTYDQVYTFPTGAEPWGGFANNNINIYPLSFPNAGDVSFKATVSADAEVYFRFEANPFPDVDPAIVTANVSLLAANDPGTVYTVDIPGNATNTYNSALFYVVTPDVDVSLSEIVITADASLGIKDYQLVDFSTYPNPTRDSWTVKTKNEKMSAIRVYSVLGKQVLSLSPNDNEAKINGSSLKTGIYFAQIKTDSGISSLKLIKQ